jgi:energy-coupling factor transport system permease protein
MTLVFLADSYLSFLLLLFFTFVVAGRAGRPFGHSLRGIRPILFIALFTLAVNSFAVKGTPLSEYGILCHITREGIEQSVRMVIRLLLLLTGASILTSTTTPLALMDGLAALMRPLRRLRVPVHELAMMMAIGLRFIPVLLEEGGRIFKAQVSRGAGFTSGNPLQRARSCIPVLVPLFAGAFRRADDLSTAMEARCFRGSAGRTRMKTLEFSRADVICVTAMLALSAVLFCMEFVKM